MPRDRSKQAKRGEKEPPGADALETRLVGLGPLELRLDGYRLTAPLPVRQGLGELCHQPFAFSLWHGPRLRVIPESRWATYLKRVCAQSRDASGAEDLASRLRQARAIRSLDRNHRWELPTLLARDAGLISKKNSVVLLPFQFGLEVLSPETWAVCLKQTLQLAEQVDAHALGFEI